MPCPLPSDSLEQVNERPCIRCQHPVLLEDGHLAYCTYCGAPQIFLSEELRNELAESARAYRESHTLPDQVSTGTPGERKGSRWNLLRPKVPANGQVNVYPWTLAVHYALLSACIALALGLLSLLVPPVSALMVLWILSAPVLTVGFFHGQSGHLMQTDSGFGIRLGLLTGVLVTFCCAAVFTLSLVLTRYVLHDAAQLDAQLAATFAQQRTLVLARLGNEVQPTLNLLNTPEYRVGLLLSVAGTSTLLYLLLAALGGGLAGAVLRRRRA